MEAVGPSTFCCGGGVLGGGPKVRSRKSGQQAAGSEQQGTGHELQATRCKLLADLEPHHPHHFTHDPH